jgi:hypothetical protein
MSLAFLCGASAASAQWLNFKAPGTPRTPDGKPNLSAPAQRASNGKPDLSGIWQAEAAPLQELVKYVPGGVNGLEEDDPSKYFFNVFSDLKPEEWPFQRAAAAAYRKQAAAPRPPMALCQPPATPMAGGAVGRGFAGSRIDGIHGPEPA